MKLIVENWNKFVSEGIEDNKHNLKYYAFDWDDNILFMPTKIILLDKSGQEVGMGSEDFAEFRGMIGKEEFDYEGHIIKDYAPNAFRYFRPEADKTFIKDAIKATHLGPSWEDFVECLNSASIFAIITARGHSPSAMKRAVYELIIRNKDGINSGDVYKNIQKYNKIFKKGDRDGSIQSYLDLCKFYPVSHPKLAGSMGKPEEAKKQALREFAEYCKDFNQGKVIKLGFSDDDPRNIEVISKDWVEPMDGVDMTVIYTGKQHGEKK
jgi:hypothetical protein